MKGKEMEAGIKGNNGNVHGMLVLQERQDPENVYACYLDEPVVAGRAPDGCNIVISHGQSISRRHCLFFLKQDKCYVRDLDSFHHTYVNQRLVTTSTPLRIGDILRLGQLELVVKDCPGNDVLKDKAVSGISGGKTKSGDYAYQEWREKNPYYGKKFSILGDSISTLEGCNPDGYSVFFTNGKCHESGVYKVADTWWGKVVGFYGGELLVNNSWSGSKVSKPPHSNKLFPSGCSDERTGRLHISDRGYGNMAPDVVIVYIGTNDWGFGVPIGAGEKWLIGKKPEIKNEKYFSFAYSEMLRKIIKNYPHAEIWCCSLTTTYMSKEPGFQFPFHYGGTHIEKYNEIIQQKVQFHRKKSGGKIKYINMYGHKMPYDTIDGAHPNAAGMSTIAAMVLWETVDGQGLDFLKNRWMLNIKKGI